MEARLWHGQDMSTQYNQKGDAQRGIKSGKSLLKKYSGQYNSLFDDADFE